MKIRPRRNHRLGVKAKVPRGRLRDEQAPVGIIQIILRRKPFLIATIVFGLMTLTTFSCGGNTPSDNTPSQAVGKYYQLLKEKDCEGLAEYINDKRPELVERRVNECKHSTNVELVRYSILREEVDGTGPVAYVQVEVTIKQDGVEKTNYLTQQLAKRDGDWKLTEIESRGEKTEDDFRDSGVDVNVPTEDG